MIVDNLMAWLPVGNEDDNAEATKQMQKVLMVARASDAAFLLVCNTPKDRQDRARTVAYLRGAIGRVEKSDMTVNLFQPDPIKDKERELYICKSRWAGLVGKAMMARQLSEEEFNFELVKGLELHQTKEAVLKGQVVQLMADMKTHEREEIAAALNIAKDAGAAQRSLDRVLSRLVKGGELERPCKGRYHTTSSPGKDS